MPEVLVSNDDITVLGPPETIELLVDVGPQGIRGSKVFVGVGDPNTLTTNGEIFSEPILLNDLYINGSPGIDYGYLHQYVSEPGGNIWTPVLKLNPTIYSVNYVTEFVAGTGASTGSTSIAIPLTRITSGVGTPLVAENFSVQYSIVNDNPIASSMTISEITGEDLVINLEAAEYDGTWQALSKEVTVHVFVSTVF